MDEPGFALSEARVVIIGLGLMGGSLALALKKNCRYLGGLDIDETTLALASRLKIADKVSSDPYEILKDADLIILACPVLAILEWLSLLPEFIQHPCLILDIGSSKRAIMAGMEALPPNFDPVGGHAICGKENLSLKNADANLFCQAPFVLTELSRTSEKAKNAALQVVEAVGAYPIWMDAESHDRILAASSHLPYLLASVLPLVLPREAAALIGPGFISTSRLAGTPASMMLGVLQSNTDNILAVLGEYQEQLLKIENALKEREFSRLETILDSARMRYLSFTH